jgi:hypothetical protein
MIGETISRSIVEIGGLTFDQYQRYKAVADLLHLLLGNSPDSKRRVLDVGGFARTRAGTAFLPLLRLCPDLEVTGADMSRPTAHDSMSRYTVASGLCLPFADGSFDAVVSCDTLEHVAADHRTDFVAELVRVCSGYVILAAPVASPTALVAERIVAEFVRLKLGLVQMQLAEHALYGLPSRTEIEAALRSARTSVVSFCCEDVFGWLLMMLAKHELLSISGTEDLTELTEALYVTYFPQGPLSDAKSDRAYRRVYVAAKPGFEGALSNVSSWARSEPSVVPAITEIASPSDSSALGLILSNLVVAVAMRESAAAGSERVDLAIDSAGAAAVNLSAECDVAEEMVVRHPNLCRIDLLLGRSGPAVESVVELRILECGSTGSLVAVSRQHVASMGSLGWVTFRIPPQLESQNRCYRMSVSVPSAEPGVVVQAYRQPALSGALVARTYTARTSYDEVAPARRPESVPTNFPPSPNYPPGRRQPRPSPAARLIGRLFGAR